MTGGLQDNTQILSQSRRTWIWA